MRVPKNKIKVNDSYFESIDSCDKAYALGIMYSDGCVWFDKQNKPHIQLKMKDRDAIETFKDLISSEHQIRDEKDGFRLIFRSRKMATDLINAGCVPGKSKVKDFPNICKDLFWPFLFGYIDGNGSITTHKNTKTIYISIYSGSESFGKQLHTKLLERGIQCSYMDYRHLNGTVKVSIGRECSVRAVFEKWSDMDIGMKRKFDKLKYNVDNRYDNTEVN